MNEQTLDKIASIVAALIMGGALIYFNYAISLK